MHVHKVLDHSSHQANFVHSDRIESQQAVRCTRFRTDGDSLSHGVHPKKTIDRRVNTGSIEMPRFTLVIEALHGPH